MAVVEPEAVNVGLVVGPSARCWWTADLSPVQGAAVRASVAAVTARPLVAVVVTHWHYDHAFGLAAFGDVETIGHESVRGRLVSAEAAWAGGRLGVDAADLAAPGRGLAVAAAVDLGERRVEIAHLGRGTHRRRPARRGPGCERGLRRRPDRVVGPAVVRRRRRIRSEWAGTLDGLVGLMTADTVAVPGHGDPVDREFVFEARGRIAAQAAGSLQQDRPSLPLIG